MTADDESPSSEPATTTQVTTPTASTTTIAMPARIHRARRDGPGAASDPASAPGSDSAEEGVDGNGSEEEREVRVRVGEQPYGLRGRGVARQPDRLPDEQHTEHRGRGHVDHADLVGDERQHEGGRDDHERVDDDLAHRGGDPLGDREHRDARGL